MPRNGVYDLCLLSNATHANYNLGELDESGRTPELKIKMLGRYTTSMRGNTRDGGPAIVQFYEGGDACGTPPQPSSARVHFYCGRRLSLTRAEERLPCTFRMNVTLPLLCVDEKARAGKLDPPKCAAHAPMHTSAGSLRSHLALAPG